MLILIAFELKYISADQENDAGHAAAVGYARVDGLSIFLYMFLFVKCFWFGLRT